MNKVSIEIALSDGSRFRVDRATEKEAVYQHNVIADAGGLLEATAAVRTQVEALTNAGLAEVVIIAFPKE